MKKDPRRTFRVENERGQIKVDLIPSFDTVEKLCILLEAELEKAGTTSWTTVGPKATSAQPKGDTKGAKGKDRKGKDGYTENVEKICRVAPLPSTLNPQLKIRKRPFFLFKFFYEAFQRIKLF